MTIELTPENERLIEQVIHSGVYYNATDVISAALEALVQDLDGVPVATGETENVRRAEAIQRLKTFGKANGLSLGGITLRQLRDEARP